MKKALFLSIAIAILAAFFASANPDGLEKVMGTSGKGGGAPVSTAAAGVTGILLAFGIFWSTAKLSKKM